MTGERRKFRREGEERRRDALICRGAGPCRRRRAGDGDRARHRRKGGGDAGLIRHYFSTKEDLTRAAYRAVMDGMNSANRAVLDAAPDRPKGVWRCLSRPRCARRWWTPPRWGCGRASFIMVQRDPAMAEIHEATYLQYRDLLQGLIAALPRKARCARSARAGDCLQRGD